MSTEGPSDIPKLKTCKDFDVLNIEKHLCIKAYCGIRVVSGLSKQHLNAIKLKNELNWVKLPGSVMRIILTDSSPLPFGQIRSPFPPSVVWVTFVFFKPSAFLRLLFPLCCIAFLPAPYLGKIFFTVWRITLQELGIKIISDRPEGRRNLSELVS